MRHTTPSTQRAATFLVTSCLAAVALAGPVWAAEDEGGPSQPAGAVIEGWVLVPTHPNARVFSASSLDGITHVALEVEGDMPFELRSAFGSEFGTCLLGRCAETADFDIVFLQANDDGTTTLLRRDSNVGPETGVVPVDADLAIIYLRTPGLVPETKGYRFAYTQSDA